MLTVTSAAMTVEIERLTEGVQDATAKLLGVRRAAPERSEGS